MGFQISIPMGFLFQSVMDLDIEGNWPCNVFSQWNFNHRNHWKRMLLWAHPEHYRTLQNVTAADKVSIFRAKCKLDRFFIEMLKSLNQQLSGILAEKIAINS